MKITYFGHSCFSIESNQHQLLFDPFVQYNELAKEVNIDEMRININEHRNHNRNLTE